MIFNKYRIGFIQFIFAVATLCLTQTGWTADLAGKVVFVRGTPQAVDTAGATRALAKGSEVFVGDKLVSNTGKIQVNLIDGGFVSVQPGTEFQIETFKYSGTADGTESATFRLLKGGVRQVTGLIGKENPEAYKIHTSVATIGIRGTGLNTRVCQGDCVGMADGVYHNCTYGTSYVANDIDSRDVPSGNAVYVRSIDSPIEVLTQTPGAVAVDTGREKSEEDEEEEDTNSVVESGNQRNDSGLLRAIFNSAGGSNTVKTGLVGLAISPDIDFPGDADFVGLEDLSLFFSSDGKPIGFLLFDDNDESHGVATFAPELLLAGNDPALVAKAQSLLALGDAAAISNALQNPAKVAEFNTIGGAFYGRWAGGNFVVVNKDSTTDIIPLPGNQSLHFIGGPQFTLPIPVSGSATYNFVGGTKSTSLSGATIGSGVTSGSIMVNFGLAQATLNMNVFHINNYTVSGILSVDPDSGLDDIGAVTASGGVGACSSICSAEVEGGFINNAAVVSGIPTEAGLGYVIDETDQITGVAAFKFP